MEAEIYQRLNSWISLCVGTPKLIQVYYFSIDPSLRYILLNCISGGQAETETTCPPACDASPPPPPASAVAADSNEPDEKDEMLLWVEDAFSFIDNDSTGYITRVEFIEAIQNNEVIAQVNKPKMHALRIYILTFTLSIYIVGAWFASDIISQGWI